MKEWFLSHLLSALILVPIVGGLVLLSCSHRWPRAKSFIFWAISAVTIILWAVLVSQFRAVFGFEFSELLPWIEPLGIQYWVACDGLSLWLMGLVVLLIPVVWTLTTVRHDPSHSGALLLLIEGAFIAVLVALDIVLAFVCLEVATLLLYLFIRQQQTEAAVTTRFLSFQLVGTAGLLFCILVLLRQSEGASSLAALIERPLSAEQQRFFGVIFLVALAIKAGLIPFQTWLYRMLSTASPAVIIIVAGLFIKMAVYWYWRFATPLFPAALQDYGGFLMGLGLLNMLVGALLTWAEGSWRAKLAGFTLVIMGLISFGLGPMRVDAAQGTLLLIVGHALAVTLFVNVQCFGSERLVLSRLIRGLSALCIVGVPGTVLFAGLFLVLMSTAFSAWSIVALAAWVLAVGACTLGSLKEEAVPSGAAGTPLRWLTAAALIIVIFYCGLRPELLLERSEAATKLWLSRVNNSIQLESRTAL